MRRMYIFLALWLFGDVCWGMKEVKEMLWLFRWILLLRDVGLC